MRRRTGPRNPDVRYAPKESGGRRRRPEHEAGTRGRRGDRPGQKGLPTPRQRAAQILTDPAPGPAQCLLGDEGRRHLGGEGTHCRQGIRLAAAGEEARARRADGRTLGRGGSQTTGQRGEGPGTEARPAGSGRPPRTLCRRALGQRASGTGKHGLSDCSAADVAGRCRIRQSQEVGSDRDRHRQSRRPWSESDRCGSLGRATDRAGCRCGRAHRSPPHHAGQQPVRARRRIGMVPRGRPDPGPSRQERRCRERGRHLHPQAVHAAGRRSARADGLPPQGILRAASTHGRLPRRRLPFALVRGTHPARRSCRRGRCRWGNRLGQLFWTVRRLQLSQGTQRVAPSGDSRGPRGHHTDRSPLQDPNQTPQRSRSRLRLWSGRQSWCEAWPRRTGSS